MTPRQIRERVTSIDRRLEKLAEWEQKLVKARARYLLEATDSSRWILNVIDHGVSGGEGTPADPELDGFERGLSGLRDTRESMARLAEERALLAEQLPSTAETDAKVREANAQASDIRSSHDTLAERVISLERALADIGKLALDVAVETHRLSDANGALDRFTRDADIDRPATPRVEAPQIAMAAPLGLILSRHYRGGSPYAIEPHVANQLRATLREPLVMG